MTHGIEHRNIEHIPESERYGRAINLFPVWFAANMQVTTIVTGALGIIIGLSFSWAIIALLIGNLFGAIFMALHSAQGPILGIPQMIQSRAQFGFIGAIVPLILVLLMYMGFFASSAVLGGQALAMGINLSFSSATILISIIVVLLAIFGYHTIHLLEQIAFIITTVIFLLLTINLLTYKDFFHLFSFHDPLNYSAFILFIAITATWQIAYAPYVADYSRYLPIKTSAAAAFWWTYSGSVISSIWMMSFGVLAASISKSAFNQGSTAFLLSLIPFKMGWIVTLTVVVGIMAIQVLNLYGMAMAFITIITALKPMKVPKALQAIFILLAAIIGSSIGLLGYGSFLENFLNFILFLTYFIVPWTAINLADFYLVRKGQYNVPEIFNPRGIYGRVNSKTMMVYVFAILIEIPFMNSPFYQGPLAIVFGGADISWILGMIAAAGLYCIMTKE